MYLIIMLGWLALCIYIYYSPSSSYDMWITQITEDRFDKSLTLVDDNIIYHIMISKYMSNVKIDIMN